MVNSIDKSSLTCYLICEHAEKLSAAIALCKLNKMWVFFSIFHWSGSLRNGLVLSYRIYIYLFYPLLTYLVMFVYHLQNVFGKCGRKVNGTCPFGSMIQTEIHFLKAVFNTVSGLRGRFLVNGERDYGKKFTSPEFCLPLLKPWTSRITHVNVQLPLSTISFCLDIRLWLMKVLQLSLRNGK